MSTSEQTSFSSAHDEGRYDYIIVGAGAAGCVLANRLGENPGVQILVIEAGGSDNSVIVSMPAALSIPMNTKRFNWGMKTEPEPGLDGRQVNLPRGKGLGGSSSINGMCWVRGNPMDYELWEALGAEGWRWSNVLPYFQRLENVEGGGLLRGTQGPMRITRGLQTNPLYQAFVRAGNEAGYAVTDNMNSRQHEGFGPMEMNVGDGRRMSAAVAYLRPAIARGNVRVIKGGLVDRVMFMGQRATGVVFSVGGKLARAMASREVILSAGAIMSPVILKRSGIGPAQELAQHGIPVIHDAPEVGENLMDHMELYLQMECTQPVSLFPTQSLLGKAKIGIEWLATRRGLGATNHFESGGHIRSRAGIVYPDIQFHFLPLAISYDGQTLAKGHGFQVHVGTKRSKSRGWVRLRDTLPQSLPRVRFNYMTHPDDWAEFRACVRLTREIFAQPAFAPYRGRELAPGAAVQDDAAIDAFLKQKLESAYHPCGTCRMGSDDAAVTFPDGRVRGVDGLRVVDASLMPAATAGDLQAPTLVLAERLSDLIRGRQLPEAQGAALLADPQWATRQRGREISRDYARERDRLAAALLANAKGQPLAMVAG
ncbi:MULTISPECIES: choline dehydrogenase [unclassified Pseudomonas]|uniref:choline dehydrogenase n=1 Tax=unclassified Pseudomonas TaxID=196821 RepID=UPI000C886E2C|nr:MULTISPECIES: choline dehydrogenase [unclassified Pseudomonas]PNA00907.1 choline dehydrogenase [Pseudomonas sp. FW305-42]PNA24818.1 choline dehydrogenase [Pseudomonas sp. MPR-R1B]PNB25049.1 choline dehydrogenase [Pseudomonas sp. DP16D-E2]PNB43345.1 choline dehydrogenase [Pseudomonas sp. FW305-17]PNB61505.1 choline dehydrogenase [Pseudomonas sp. GW531-E2]